MSGVDLVLIMAENFSEQVGMSQSNQSFIQSCRSALVLEWIHSDPGIQLGRYVG